VGLKRRPIDKSLRLSARLGRLAAAESGGIAAAATATSAASAAAASAAATSAAAAATRDLLEAGANVLFLEEMERGETDVGHFLFAKNEALIRRGIIRLRDTSSGHRGCGCTTDQRKTQSGGTQHLHGGGFGCAFLPRSLPDPWHGRILRKFFL
jgi:hypothetical protein